MLLQFVMKPTYYFEILTTIAGIVSAIMILRKNYQYLGNRLMASALLLTGLYPFCVFIYDIIATEWAVQIFLRIGMVSTMAATLLIFYTMQCLVNSDQWFKKPGHWLPYAIVVFLAGIYVALAQTIDWKGGSIGNVNVKVGYDILLSIVLLVLFFLISSFTYLYLYGIKRSSGQSRKKMVIFGIGVLINILAVVNNIISNVVSDDLLGVIFDVIFFANLALGVIVMSIGFLLPSEKTEDS